MPIPELGHRGLQRPQASAQTVENENEGAPERSSLGVRTLRPDRRAHPEWAAGASGKPATEARRAGASPRMNWSGVDTRPKSTGSSLVSRLADIFWANKTSAKPIGAKPRLRTDHDTSAAIVEGECIELEDIESQDGSANRAQPSNLQPTRETDLTNENETAIGETKDLPPETLLHTLFTNIASGATHAEYVARLSEVITPGLDPETLVSAFKNIYPLVEQGRGLPPATAIITLTQRAEMGRLFEKKSRKEGALELKDCCKLDDPISVQRGKHRMEYIEFLTSLNVPHSRWFAVALLSDTQIACEKALTDEDKIEIEAKFQSLEPRLNTLLYDVLYSPADKSAELRRKLDLFDEEAAHVGLLIIIDCIENTFPSLRKKFSLVADSKSILNALCKYHKSGWRLVEETLQAFLPEKQALETLYANFDKGLGAADCLAPLKTALRRFEGFRPESLKKYLNKYQPSRRIPAGLNSLEDIFSWILRSRLINSIVEKPHDGTQTDTEVRQKRIQNRSEWIDLIRRALPDSVWVTGALLSDQQLTGEEKAKQDSQQKIIDNLNRLRKSLCDLMPYVFEPRHDQNVELLKYIDQFDEDVKGFGLQWMIARIKTRHPDIDLEENADAPKILDAVRHHYERSKQRPLQPEKALLEALLDTIRGRASFETCLRVLERGHEILPDVTPQTLIERLRLDYPDMRPPAEGVSYEDIVILMLRYEVGVDFGNSGRPPDVWQSFHRCNLAEPLFSDGRADTRRRFVGELIELKIKSVWLARALLSDAQLAGEDTWTVHTRRTLKAKMEHLEICQKQLISDVLDPHKNQAADLSLRMDSFDQLAGGVGLQWLIETITERHPDIDLPLHSNAQQILDAVRKRHS